MKRKDKITTIFIIIGILFTLVFALIPSVIAINYDYARGLENNSFIWTKINLTANQSLILYITNTTPYNSSPDNVFLLYDEFNGNTLNTSKWIATGGLSAVVSGGNVTISSPSNSKMLMSITNFSIGNGIMLISNSSQSNGDYALELSNPLSSGGASNIVGNGSQIYMSNGANINNIYSNVRVNGTANSPNWVSTSSQSFNMLLTKIWIRANTSSNTRNTYTDNITFGWNFTGIFNIKFYGTASTIDTLDYVEVVKKASIEPTISCFANVCNITSSINLTDYNVILTSNLNGNINISNSLPYSPPLPITIYNPICSNGSSTTFTVGTNRSMFISWSNATNQYQVQYYITFVGDVYNPYDIYEIPNITTLNYTLYSNDTLPYSLSGILYHNNWSLIIRANDGITNSSKVLNCIFTICENNYQRTLQPCLNQYKLVSYVDTNNCDELINFPITNNTYESCSAPITAGETNITNALYALVVVGLVYLLIKIKGGKHV